MRVTGKEIDPAEHRDKDVRKALQSLVQAGWRLRKEGHWGRLSCPCGCLRIQVPGTPGSASRTARRITREARHCPLPAEDPRRGPASSG